MKTIEADIPEPVFKQAQEFATRENIPLRHLISLALTQAIGMWSNESYVASRARHARHASRDSFLEALKEVPDVPAQDFDRPSK